MQFGHQTLGALQARISQKNETVSVPYGTPLVRIGSVCNVVIPSQWRVFLTSRNPVTPRNLAVELLIPWSDAFEDHVGLSPRSLREASSKWDVGE